MRKTECKTNRRLLDRSVVGENSLEWRRVDRLVRLSGGLHLFRHSERALQRSSSVFGDIVSKAHNGSERRVPEKESRRDCAIWLVDRHEVAGGIVRELGLNMQLHDIEIRQHVHIAT